MLDFYRPFQGQDAIMKHNSARGAKTVVKKKNQNGILNIGRAYYANTACGLQSIPYDLKKGRPCP
jgi:hypothetical protein